MLKGWLGTSSRSRKRVLPKQWNILLLAWSLERINLLRRFKLGCGWIGNRREGSLQASEEKTSVRKVVLLWERRLCLRLC